MVVWWIWGNENLDTLFTGLAFAGAFAAYRTQHHVLEASRKQTRLSQEQNMDVACFEYLKYLEVRKSAISMLDKGELKNIKGKQIRLKKKNPFDYINFCRRKYQLLLKEGSSDEKKKAYYLQDIKKQLREMGTWYRIIMLWLERVVITYRRNPPLRRQYVTTFLLSLSKNERQCLKLYSHVSGFTTYTNKENEFGEIFLQDILKEQENGKLTEDKKDSEGIILLPFSFSDELSACRIKAILRIFFKNNP